MVRQREACAALWVQADLGWFNQPLQPFPDRLAIRCYTSLINSAVVGVEALEAAWAASARLAPGNLGVVQKHLSQSYQKSDLIRF